MKIFEELGTDGYMDYKVEIGGEVLCFPTKEEREKFLFRLWLDLLQKMLRSQQLQEALQWLWEERQDDVQKVTAQYFSVFVALVLPLDNYFYSLPPAVMSANQAYLQAMARDFVEMTVTLILQAPPAPALKQSYEEARARTLAKNNTPRG